MKTYIFKLAAFVLLLAGSLVSCGERMSSDAFVKTGKVKYFSLDEPDNCKDYMLVVEDK
jgi:hypothetical protein